MFPTLTELLISAAGVAVIGSIVRVALTRRYHFQVTIRKEGLVMSTGRVPADFLSGATTILGEYQVTSGWIGGVRHGKQIRLHFSSNIPPACQQRLRNLWVNP